MGPRTLLVGPSGQPGRLILAAPLPDWASPNFGPRRGVTRPDLIVLHYTAMADANAARRVLCDPKTEVSAHYLITETGDVQLLVPEEMRAWHAGAGAWGPVTDINSHSVGIELSNTGFAPFSAPLMAALDTLLGQIIARWHIPPERVIAHSDCAPGRKIDPGPRFDWKRLARQGLAIWPNPAGAGPSVDDDLPGAIDKALQAFGYTAQVPADVRLAAFRLRFRPRHTGPADGIDLTLARDLATRFPVDRGGVWA